MERTMKILIGDTQSMFGVVPDLACFYSMSNFREQGGISKDTLDFLLKAIDAEVEATLEGSRCSACGCRHGQDAILQLDIVEQAGKVDYTMSMLCEDCAYNIEEEDYLSGEEFTQLVLAVERGFDALQIC